MIDFLARIFSSQRSAAAVALLPRVSTTLGSPEDSLEFLKNRFSRYEIKDDGALYLPRLDLTSAWGPQDDDGIVVHYGDLVLSAVQAIDPDATITKIVIGGYGAGLALYYGERRLIIVGDAFVIGDEPMRGDHSECALCAFFIAGTITDLDNQALKPIRMIGTRGVVLEKNSRTWTIQVQ